MSENIGHKNFVAASLITIMRVWLLLCEFDYYYETNEQNVSAKKKQCKRQEAVSSLVYCVILNASCKYLGVIKYWVIVLQVILFYLINDYDTDVCICGGNNTIFSFF